MIPVETVVFLPGYLSPPAGFRSMAGAFVGYQTLELSRQPRPSLEGWLDRVPAGAHIVAFAEAAWNAAQIAAQKSAKSLILFSPILRSDAALEARLKALQTAHNTSLENFIEAAKPWFFGSFFLQQGHEALEVWAEEMQSLQLGDWLEAMLTLPDGRKNLRKLECPVLVCLGSEDVFTPLRYGQEVVEWVPLNQNGLGAVRVSLEGCGHLAPWENPLEATNLAQGFIAQADGISGDQPAWQDLEELPIK